MDGSHSKHDARPINRTRLQVEKLIELFWLLDCSCGSFDKASRKARVESRIRMTALVPGSPTAHTAAQIMNDASDFVQEAGEQLITSHTSELI